MSAFIKPLWSEEYITTLRTNWLAGWSDGRLSTVLPFTGKQIREQRRRENLVKEHHPERTPTHPTKPHTDYTENECNAILARYNSGEPPRLIAVDYGVSGRAMEHKIDRILRTLLAKPPPEPTGRQCLRCSVWFLSIRPKKDNRICPSCTDIVTREGPTFLSL